MWHRGPDWHEPVAPPVYRDEITITLDRRDVTHAQFLELSRALRRWLELDRVRAMTASDRQILATAKKVDREDFKSERQYVAALYKNLPRKLKESIALSTVDPSQVLGSRYRRLKKRLEKRVART